MNQTQQSFYIVCPYSPNGKNRNKTKSTTNKTDIALISDNRQRRRPLYEVKLAEDLDIVRQELNNQNRILLPLYNTYAYYSCEQSEMDQKIQHHMTSTNAYRFLMDCNEIDNENLNKFLIERDHHITIILNNLLHFHCITFTQWQQLICHSIHSQYDLLYFLPNIRIDPIEFRPMILNRHRFTLNIDQFLSRLLQPIYDHFTTNQTFYNGADALLTLHEYTRIGRLQSNTLFVHLYIPDLSISIPNEILYQYLQRFLMENKCDENLNGLTIPTILHLTRIGLEERYLLYDNKIYQQIKGGPLNSSLTMILCNIYLYYWQQDLVNYLNENNEIFGRYNDELFFTWNQPEKALNDILCSMNPQEFTLLMRLRISNEINYLDVNLSHTNGHLKTKIAHHLDTEPYALPYVYGYFRISYRNLLQANLRRAVRCCTTVSDFTTEVQQIQYSFLYNNFNEKFISDEIQSFLDKFYVSDLKVHCGEQRHNQELYEHLRYNVTRDYNRERRRKIQLKPHEKLSQRQRYFHLKQYTTMITNVQSYFI